MWKRKKERRLEKRAKAKEKRVMEWVCKFQGDITLYNTTAIYDMQEEDKQRRKNEIIAEYEAKVAARKEKKAAKLAQADDNGTKYSMQ